MPRSNDIFSSQEHLMFVGVGFLIVGILGIVALRGRWVAEYKLRWVIAIVSIFVGLTLVILGAILK